MKILALISLSLFSITAFASDLSFGSFDTEEKVSAPVEQSVDLSFASFEQTSESQQGRSIASVEEVPSTKVDPIAFGSFE